MPQAELERIAGFGFDGIWLMGVWRRSRGARRVSQTNPGWQEAYRQALPDYAANDVAGSPYAISDYSVDPMLGGEHGLAALRHRLQDLGLRLMLDFVPNHMALDHAWLRAHPQRLVQGGPDLLEREPENYFQTEIDGRPRVFAYGRDPYFAGWPDTVQLDYRKADTRRAMSDILLSIAQRCDGVRCDMAMLLTHDVFLRTWGGSFDPPRAEYWPAAITDLKARHPGFLTLAEVYWDMEWEMQQQGFDYTYDKRLYDRLLEGDGALVHAHLSAGGEFPRHLAHFVENHDERRAAEAFGVQRSKAAAALALTLPGLRLVHEGQIEGYRVKIPVHLGRRQAEEPVEELESFYRLLLDTLRHAVFHEGQWQLLEPRPERADESNHDHVIAHQWTHDDTSRVVIVNLSDQPAELRLPLKMPGLVGRDWLLRDLLNKVDYIRAGDEISGMGLSVRLPAYGFHLFEVRPA